MGRGVNRSWTTIRASLMDLAAVWGWTDDRDAGLNGAPLTTVINPLWVSNSSGQVRSAASCPAKAPIGHEITWGLTLPVSGSGGLVLSLRASNSRASPQSLFHQRQRTIIIGLNWFQAGVFS